MRTITNKLQFSRKTQARFVWVLKTVGNNTIDYMFETAHTSYSDDKLSQRVQNDGWVNPGRFVVLFIL